MKRGDLNIAQLRLKIHCILCQPPISGATDLKFLPEKVRSKHLRYCQATTVHSHSYAHLETLNTHSCSIMHDAVACVFKIEFLRETGKGQQKVDSLGVIGGEPQLDQSSTHVSTGSKHSFATADSSRPENIGFIGVCRMSRLLGLPTVLPEVDIGGVDG